MNSRELRAKSFEIANKARELLNTITDENRSDKEVEFQRMLSESDSLKTRADDVARLEAREAEAEQIVTELPEQRSDNRNTDTREQAFNDYLRGKRSLAEVRAMGVATDAKGGAFVPTTFQNTLITKLRTEGPMLNPNVVTILNTDSGNPIEMPTFDDDARAVIIGENTLIPEDDLATGSVTIGAYKYTSKMVRVSRELLEDSAVDVTALVTDALSKRIGRGLNEDLTNGTGVNMPKGIAVGAGVGVTAAIATGVADTELVALQHSIDAAYRADAKFMLNDAAALKFRSMKDANGQFVWSPGLTVGAPDTLLGQSYIINPYLNGAFTTGKIVALHGDFKRYTVRMVNGILVRRLDERYADYDQVAFVALVRADGALLDNSAVKALKLA